MFQHLIYNQIYMNSDRAHRRLVALTLVVTSSRRQRPSLFVISFLVEFVVFLIYFIPACFVFDKNCFLSITVTKAVGERVGERDGEM
jgi:hypothetical protein